MPDLHNKHFSATSLSEFEKFFSQTNNDYNFYFTASSDIINKSGSIDYIADLIDEYIDEEELDLDLSSFYDEDNGVFLSTLKDVTFQIIQGGDIYVSQCSLSKKLKKDDDKKEKLEWDKDLVTYDILKDISAGEDLTVEDIQFLIKNGERKEKEIKAFLENKNEIHIQNGYFIKTKKGKNVEINPRTGKPFKRNRETRLKEAYERRGTENSTDRESKILDLVDQRVRRYLKKELDKKLHKAMNQYQSLRREVYSLVNANTNKRVNIIKAMPSLEGSIYAAGVKTEDALSKTRERISKISNKVSKTSFYDTGYAVPSSGLGYRDSSDIFRKKPDWVNTPKRKNEQLVIESTLSAAKIAKVYKFDTYYGCLIAATFFQILVSNTPIDEDYTYTRLRKIKRRDRHIKFTQDNNGTKFLRNAKDIADEILSKEKIEIREEPAFHKADKKEVRGDWVLTFRDKNIKAYETEPERYADTMKIDITLKREYFEKKSDEESISKIANILHEITKDDEKNNLSLKFSYNNLNPRWKILELGGYSPIKEGEPRKGAKYGLLHGVKNGFVYQAPKGFIRIVESLWNMTVNSGRWHGYISRFLNHKNNKLDVSDLESPTMKKLFQKMKEGEFGVWFGTEDFSDSKLAWADL